MLCGLALSNQEVMDWVRSIDLEPILQSLPGTELLSRIWHGHFPAGDGPAQAAFFASLPEDEQAAFVQLHSQAMPGGKLDDAQQAWNSLDLARLHHLVQQTQAKMMDPAIDPAKVAEMHQQVMAWRKEYLDRTKASQDTP